MSSHPKRQQKDMWPLGPVPSSALKARSREVFAALADGRQVLISRYGHIVAIIEPILALGEGEFVAAQRAVAERRANVVNAQQINQAGIGQQLSQLDRGSSFIVARELQAAGVMRAVASSDISTLVDLAHDSSTSRNANTIGPDEHLAASLARHVRACFASAKLALEEGAAMTSLSDLLSGVLELTGTPKWQLIAFAIGEDWPSWAIRSLPNIAVRDDSQVFLADHLTPFLKHEYIDLLERPVRHYMHSLLRLSPTDMGPALGHLADIDDSLTDVMDNFPTGFDKNCSPDILRLNGMITALPRFESSKVHAQAAEHRIYQDMATLASYERADFGPRILEVHARPGMLPTIRSTLAACIPSVESVHDIDGRSKLSVTYNLALPDTLSDELQQLDGIDSVREVDAARHGHEGSQESSFLEELAHMDPKSRA